MADNVNIVIDPISAALGGVVGVFLVLILLLLLAYYIYNSLALMVIARKLGVDKPWLAWIPIANVYLMTQMVPISGWWTFALLLGLIPTIGALLLVAGFLYLWWKICGRLGRPNWWAILLMLPVINLIALGLLAWGKDETKKTSKSETVQAEVSKPKKTSAMKFKKKK